MTSLSVAEHVQREHRARVWGMGKYKAVETPGTGMADMWWL